MQLWLLAAHARGALPLVGAAWGVTARKANHNGGVTARKANHNASNARGATAGKMVCVSVKYRQTWHAYADGPGDGSYLNKFDPPPKGGGVEVGIFGGQKNQKSGKCHELSRKKMWTHPTPGGGVWGSKFQKSGKFHELPRKSINIYTDRWEF